MKRMIALILLSFPLVALAQTQRDYERTMLLFKKYYNSGDTEHICEMFGLGESGEVTFPDRCGWAKNNLKESGEILSQKFIGLDKGPEGGDSVHVFKVRYSITGEKSAKLFT